MARQTHLDLWQRNSGGEDELQLLFSSELPLPVQCEQTRIDHLVAVPGPSGAAADALLVVSAGLTNSCEEDGARVSCWRVTAAADGSSSLTPCSMPSSRQPPDSVSRPSFLQALFRRRSAAGDAAQSLPDVLSDGAAAASGSGQACPPRLEGPLVSALAPLYERRGGERAWLLAVACHSSRLQVLRLRWLGEELCQDVVANISLDARADALQGLGPWLRLSPKISRVPCPCHLHMLGVPVLACCLCVSRERMLHPAQTVRRTVHPRKCMVAGLSTF